MAGEERTEAHTNAASLECHPRSMADVIAAIEPAPDANAGADGEATVAEEANAAEEASVAGEATVAVEAVASPEASAAVEASATLEASSAVETSAAVEASPLKLVRATFAFDAGSANQMSFQVGDVIKVVEVVNADWSRAKLGDASGLIPMNRVEEYASPEATATTPEAATVAVEAIVEAGAAEAAPTGPKTVARAIHDFPGDVGELTFTTGDILEVVEEYTEDWWRGRVLSGTVPGGAELGLFPSNRVALANWDAVQQEIEAAAAAAAADAAAAAQALAEEPVDVTGEELCELCTASHIASHRCIPCGQYMCQPACDIHRVSIATSSHKMMTVQEFKTLAGHKLKEMTEKPCCAHHPEPVDNQSNELTLFCTTCTSAICSSCLLDRHPYPDHEVVPLAHGMDVGREAVAGILTGAARHSENIAEAIFEVSKMKVSLNKQHAEGYKSVQAAFATLREAVEKQEAAMLGKLQEVCDGVTEPLVVQMSTLEENKAKLDQHCAIVQEALNNGTDAQIMRHKPQLETELLKHQQAVLVPRGTNHLWINTYATPVVSAMNKIGTALFPNVDATKCTALGEGLTGQQGVGVEATFEVVLNDGAGARAKLPADASDRSVFVSVEMYPEGGGAKEGGGRTPRLPASTPPVIGTTVDNGESTFTCSYFPVDDATHTIRVLVLGVEICGSPWTVKPKLQLRSRRKIELRYSHPFDKNGAMYFFGTKGGTQEYQNPHEIGEVKVSALNPDSGITYYSPHRFVQHKHDGCRNHTNKVASCWMKVVLPPGAWLDVNFYCLRHDANSHHVLRNWALQGSVDGNSWFTLRHHFNDTAMKDEKFSVGAWSVEKSSSSQAYAQFRIIQTGANSSGVERLMCAGMELYGTLVALAPGSKK